MSFEIKNGVLRNYREEPGVTEVVIPDGVTRIGEHALYSRRNITAITIPENVTHIGAEAFRDCDGLEEITLPSSQAKRLFAILPKSQNIVIHMEDITGISTRYRPGAAVGFAEDDRDCADKNGKKYCRYIRSYAAKLIGAAVEHPALFRLMLREKLIDAKDMWEKTCRENTNLPITQKP